MGKYVPHSEPDDPENIRMKTPQPEPKRPAPKAKKTTAKNADKG